MGDVLNNSSVRFARDNWNYREQNSLERHCLIYACSVRERQAPWS